MKEEVVWEVEEEVAREEEVGEDGSRVRWVSRPSQMVGLAPCGGRPLCVMAGAATHAWWWPGRQLARVRVHRGGRRVVAARLINHSGNKLCGPHTHTHAHVHTHTHTHTYTYCTHMSAHSDAHAQKHTHTDTHAHECTSANAHIHAQEHT